MLTASHWPPEGETRELVQPLLDMGCIKTWRLVETDNYFDVMKLLVPYGILFDPAPKDHAAGACGQRLPLP